MTTPGPNDQLRIVNEVAAASLRARGIDAFVTVEPEPAPLDFDALVRAVIGSRYQWVRLEDAVDMAVNTVRTLAHSNAARVTADGVPLDVHGSLGALRRYIRASGALDDEAEHDPARPRPYPISGAHPAVVDALHLIDRHGCSTYTRGRCLDPYSGKKRGAPQGADAWCDACIARDALNKLEMEAQS